MRSLALRAIHVDHGLQPAAADFRRTCVALCARLHVPLDIMTVTVPNPVSIEAAAREARYRALALALRPRECLLTAHHAMDQAETLLLQLLRGAGLKGLSAMPLVRPFGSGWHVRPLLDVSHGELLGFAAQARVIELAAADPMNHDMRFDRAYLRSQVWPLIEARWPGAEAALARTARHVADAQALLDEAAAEVVQRLRDGNALSVTGLRSLPPPAQRNALRYWIAAAGLKPPPAARLAEALRQVDEADEESLPAVVWGEHALRRYRNRLFVTPATPSCITDCEWPIGMLQPLLLGAELGTLRLAAQRGGLDAARLPPLLQVRRRAGGETLKPHRRARTQSVQHLYQSRGVLPWMRDTLPMLYAGDALIAIGDQWLDARWCAAPQAPGLRIVWRDAPVFV
jgi:tRNA(Ile)-lysidine synthase